MRTALALLIVAACGRGRFDDTSDGAPTGHDGDANGLPDAIDFCP